MDNLLAILLCSICLYSTGHWIGGTVCLILYICALWKGK